MPKTLLRIINENTSFDVGGWSSTTWTIRDDMTAIVNIRYYMNDGKDDDKLVNISQDKYEQIFELLDEVKKELPITSIIDGDTWEMKQFNEDGLEIYNRKRGYISGLPNSELLAKLLYKATRISI